MEEEIERGLGDRNTICEGRGTGVKLNFINLVGNGVRLLVGSTGLGVADVSVSLGVKDGSVLGVMDGSVCLGVMDGSVLGVVEGSVCLGVAEGVVEGSVCLGVAEGVVEGSTRFNVAEGDDVAHASDWQFCVAGADAKHIRIAS